MVGTYITTNKKGDNVELTYWAGRDWHSSKINGKEFKSFFNSFSDEKTKFITKTLEDGTK